MGFERRKSASLTPELRAELPEAEGRKKDDRLDASEQHECVALVSLIVGLCALTLKHHAPVIRSYLSSKRTMSSSPR
jgi:hypothetical protein